MLNYWLRHFVDHMVVGFQILTESLFVGLFVAVSWLCGYV